VIGIFAAQATVDRILSFMAVSEVLGGKLISMELAALFCSVASMKSNSGSSNENGVVPVR
jgi:hypothetical protein